MVHTSVINAAVSLLQSKIVVSDGRWDAWSFPFVKALNAANGTKFEYDSWYTDATYYCMVFKVIDGSVNYVTVGFVNSVETGQKYEFAAAWTGDKARTKATRQTQIAWGSGWRYASAMKVGKECQNGNDLASTISKVTSATSDQNYNMQRNDVFNAVAKYLNSKVSLFSYCEGQGTKSEKIRDLLEKADIDFGTTARTSTDTVEARATLTRNGLAVKDSDIVSAGADPKEVKALLSDSNLLKAFGLGIGVSLRSRAEFKDVFTAKPSIQVKAAGDYTISLSIMIP